MIVAIKIGASFLYLVSHENKKYAKVYIKILQIITSNQPRPSVNFDRPQSDIADAAATKSGLAILKFNMTIIPTVATMIVAISPAALANPTNLDKYKVRPQYRIPNTTPTDIICQTGLNLLTGRESILLLTIFATLAPPYNIYYYTFLLPN